MEFAIVSPLLLGLLLGIWEVGRLIDVQQVLNNAVREGGRQASSGQVTANQVEASVINYLTLAGLNTNGAQVTVTNLTSGLDPTQANQLDEFQIVLTLPFNNVRWVLVPQVTNVTTLNATSYWYSFNDQPVTVSNAIPQ